MPRFGILGRVLLMFLSALVILAVVSLLLLRWQDMHQPRSGPFLRVRETALALDLLAQTPASAWPDDLRALGGSNVRFRLQDGTPALAGLIHAPRLEAKLHAASHTAVGAGARVYTDVDQSRRDPRDRVEGFMALATARLPDGHFLVATPVLGVDRGTGSPLGLPPGAWIGLCGAVLAALAVFGAVRETRPLRALTRMLDTFDGGEVAAIERMPGAPDVRALAIAVNAMQHRVAQSMRDRTLMVGAVSHDLRTLLTRLQLRVLALADETARARLESDLDAMRALVEDALAYARGSEAALRRHRVDLADLVASEIAEREAVGAGLPVEAALADAPVRGDAVALRRVVANLVDNAAKFGRSRVLVTTARRGGRVELSVEDDGPGVSPAERAAVLQPFKRLEGSRSRETGGTGLGLAIADRIVGAHGGEVSLHDSALGGLRVLVSLPADM